MASEGIREGVFVWAIEKGEKLLSTQYSVLLFVTAVWSEICKEISIYIIYNNIIYIDITFFLPFLMVSHTKVTQLNTEYWVTSFGREIVENAGQDAELALIKLSELFNHSNTAVTRRYLGLRKEELLETYNLLRFWSNRETKIH